MRTDARSHPSAFPLVRRAEAHDLPAVAALLQATRAEGRAPGADELTALAATGVFLVLDRGGGPAAGLAAVVYVRLVDERGHVGLLAVAPELRSQGLAARMLGVADALCAAFHCTPVDWVPAV